MSSSNRRFILPSCVLIFPNLLLSKGLILKFDARRVTAAEIKHMKEQDTLGQLQNKYRNCK
jgi:hypothetical protein